MKVPKILKTKILSCCCLLCKVNDTFCDRDLIHYRILWKIKFVSVWLIFKSISNYVTWPWPLLKVNKIFNLCLTNVQQTFNQTHDFIHLCLVFCNLLKRVSLICYFVLQTLFSVNLLKHKASQNMIIINQWNIHESTWKWNYMKIHEMSQITHLNDSALSRSEYKLLKNNMSWKEKGLFNLQLMTTHGEPVKHQKHQLLRPETESSTIP